jgi:hypothetical protein
MVHGVELGGHGIVTPSDAHDDGVTSTHARFPSLFPGRARAAIPICCHDERRPPGRPVALT